MKYRYITIEREYGSGGTQIGKKLGEICNVPCYGREILETVAQKRGISTERIDQYEEKATGSLIYSLFLMNRVQSGDANMLPEEGKVFLDEQMEIRRLAQNGPGIFMGHCAAYALKNMKGVAKVFIYCSSEEDIKKRIVEEYGIDPQNVEATRKYYNKKRSAYFRANTGKVWDGKKNYDIVLDSGTLGIEGCVKALKGLFEE